MTEQDWLASEDPMAMLRLLTGSDGLPRPKGTEHFRHWPGERKLRLWVEACRDCETARFPSQVYAPAHGDLSNARTFANALEAWQNPMEAEVTMAERAALLREIVGNPWRPVTPLYHTISGQVRYSDSGATRLGVDPDIQIPACPWLTPTVRLLAEAAYADRQADGTLDDVRLAILADCLEEAGCTSEPLLMHLRGKQWVYGQFSDSWFWHPLDGPHVRGCWALDLICGKE
jgi:hypothetical protein